MAITINRLNTNFKIPCGDKQRCYGTISFSAGGDTYVTGGFNILAAMKLAFGVARVLGIRFFNGGSDASGPTTGYCIAKYDAQTGFVKFFLCGRTSGSPGIAQVSDTEVANGASVDSCRFDFVAFCDGAGTSSPSGAYT
jgi:hypothetical protein